MGKKMTDEQIKELGQNAFGFDIAFDGHLMEFARRVEAVAVVNERERFEHDDLSIGDEAADRITELEDLLFATGQMMVAPCFCCGYNGPGYYQPQTHPCAKRHHESYTDGYT